MSVRIMAEVFDRYAGGGTELLLALAIADHAHDDGTHVYPSVRRLAEKTRQSERSVQYHLRKMEADGWLIPVANLAGGRSNPREYRISPAWIKGAISAPIEKGAEIAGAEKGAGHDDKGCKTAQERVQNSAEKGATAIAPEPSVNHKAIVEQSSKTKRASRVRIPTIDLPDWVPRADWDGYVAMRNMIRKPMTDKAAELAVEKLEALRKHGHDPGGVLRQSIFESWQGLFAIKAEQNGRTNFSAAGRRESTADYVERVNGELDEFERHRQSGRA